MATLVYLHVIMNVKTHLAPSLQQPSLVCNNEQQRRLTVWPHSCSLLASCSCRNPTSVKHRVLRDGAQTTSRKATTRPIQSTTRKVPLQLCPGTHTSAEVKSAQSRTWHFFCRTQASKFSENLKAWALRTQASKFSEILGTWAVQHLVAPASIHGACVSTHGRAVQTFCSAGTVAVC